MRSFLKFGLWRPQSWFKGHPQKVKQTDGINRNKCECARWERCDRKVSDWFRIHEQAGRASGRTLLGMAFAKGIRSSQIKATKWPLFASMSEIPIYYSTYFQSVMKAKLSQQSFWLGMATNSIFFWFLFVKKIINLRGKSMTLNRGISFSFVPPSNSPHLRLGPLKGFLSWHGAL